MGSGFCISFVDEREFKEEFVLGHCRLEKNRPSGFVEEPNGTEIVQEFSVIIY